MSAARVVEAVDVFKEGDFDVAAGLPVSAPEQFGLEGFEELLDGRVITAIFLATQRHRQPMFAQDVGFVAQIARDFLRDSKVSIGLHEQTYTPELSHDDLARLSSH